MSKKNRIILAIFTIISIIAISIVTFIKHIHSKVTNNIRFSSECWDDKNI